MTTDEAQAAARNAAARNRNAADKAKITRALNTLLATVLELDGERLAPVRMEGRGWTASRYLGQGTPGSDVIHLELRVGDGYAPEKRFPL